MWLARLYSKWRSGMTPREKLTKTICLSADVTIVSAHSILDAILAALPTLGFKIVPVEATDRMLANIGIVHNNTPYCEIYDAMLAAAPDVLGDGK